MFLKTDNAKRIFLIALLMIGIALFFWDQSRIPALTAKAQMGIRTQIDAIAFDVIFPVLDSYSLLQRILFTSINWAYTNWKGMTFGLLFGAACLSLVRLIPQRSSGNIFLNSLKGTLIGAPLGVCVNCSTPIMQGMQRGGMRLESVLSTLSSSPTLNIIVLTMSFSILPLEFAVAKLLAVLVFVLLVVPLVVRAHYQQSDISQQQETSLSNTTHPDTSAFTSDEAACDLNIVTPAQTPLVKLLFATAIDYLKDIWFIARIAVPFMLLAGVLGSAVIETVPLEGLEKLPMATWSLVLVALIGTFLPVPIALDVLLVSILISAGMPTAFAMVLLFTLGVFSVYPFMVIWRDISRRIALSLFTGVIFLGVTTGYAVDYYQTRQSASIDEQYISALQHSRTTHQVEAELAAFILEQAEAQCHQLTPNKDREICTRDYILHRVQASGDNSLCFGLTSNRLRNFCFQQASFLVITQDAVSSDTPALCEKIGVATIATFCKRKVVNASISGGSPLSRCDLLIAPEAVNHCKLEGFFTRLRKYNDTNVCENFSPGRERTACLGTLKIFKHTSGNNYADCKRLGTERDQQLCKAMIAKRLVSAGEGESHCDRIIDAKGYGQCISLASSIKAVDQLDPTACNLVTGKKEEAQCRQEVINASVDRAISDYLIDKAQYTTKSQHSVAATDPEQPVAGKKITPVSFDKLIIRDDIQVTATPHFNSTSSGEKAFSAHSYSEHGLLNLPKIGFLEFKAPFIKGRGIASGDYNNDHWPDLLFAGRKGVQLYTNTSGGHFTHTTITTDQMDYPDIHLVAFVDIDNDGWQDIYAAGYGGKNYFILNDQQGFSHSTLVKIPNEASNLSMATGFADLDRNGYLDFVLGNWSFSDAKNFLTHYSQNRLFLNNELNFTSKTFPGELNGETLSTLFSDINQDNQLDLIVANDVRKPDYYYRGAGKGVLKRIKPEEAVISATSLNTMSVDTADFNNDLRLDLFTTDMSFSGESEVAYCDGIEDKQQQQRCRLLLEGKEQIALGNIKWCINLEQPEERSDCMTAVVRDMAMAHKQPEECQKILPEYPLQRLFCRKVAKREGSEENFPLFEHHPQVQSNKLMLGTADGHFKDATADMGVGESFWSWNSKAADLDNDGWQDIYIGNGYGFGSKEREIHSNILFHNQQGRGFIQAQEPFGLREYINTPSYTYVDFDLDGDLDIVTTGMLAEGKIFINNNPKVHNAISFELRDERGNHFAIGAKVIITTATGQQIRELKLSGGFLSFDNPYLHFGLGDGSAVGKIEVIWPDGEHTNLEGDFAANHHYRIKRTKN